MAVTIKQLYKKKKKKPTLYQNKKQTSLLIHKMKEGGYSKYTYPTTRTPKCGRFLVSLRMEGFVCFCFVSFLFLSCRTIFFIETQSDASFSGRNGGKKKWATEKNPKAKQLYLAISDTMWCGGKLPLICIRLIFVFLISIFVHTFEIDWLETEIKPPVRCITITTHKQNSFG